jgi:hypothetical protein
MGCSIIVVSRHSLPCSGEFSVTVDDALLLAVIVSQLVDIFGLCCCVSIFGSSKYVTI